MFWEEKYAYISCIHYPSLDQVSCKSSLKTCWLITHKLLDEFISAHKWTPIGHEMGHICTPEAQNTSQADSKVGNNAL